MALSKYVMQPTPGADLRRYASAELQKIEKSIGDIIIDSTDIRAALEAAQSDIDDLETADVVADLRLDALETNLAAIVANPTWTAVGAMSNSWVNYGGGWAPLAYAKDALGFVHIRGLIKSGTVGLIFNLPAGYRPQASAGDLLFPSFNNTLLGRIDVAVGGAVSASVVPDANYVSMNISFFAGN